MQAVRGILNTINMNILPTITDFSFRNKIVEIVFANLTETLEMEAKFKKKMESMDGILDIRIKKPKLLKIIIFGSPLVSPISEKITGKDTPEFKYVD